jgi:hypothetical protein
MSSVYVAVSEAPSKIGHAEMVIKKPTFVDEVRACQKYRGAGQVGVNYLRTIAAEVGKLCSKTFNPYRHVVPSDWAGVHVSSDEEVARIVRAMFEATYPQVYEQCYENLLKVRPIGIRVIYAVGEVAQSGVFAALGIPQVQPEHVQEYLTYPVDTFTVSKVLEITVESAPDLPQVTEEEAQDALADLIKNAEPAPVAHKKKKK